MGRIMKILDVSKESYYFVTTDEEDYSNYRRHSGKDFSPDAWEQGMGESWESCYDEELEGLFQQYLENNGIVGNDLRETYVVTMYRFANEESHSYVLGVFSSEVKAKIAAQEERQRRDGKYYEEIKYFILDNPADFEIIVDLDKSFTMGASGKYF